MALDAKMISQAEQVSALTDNSLISVSEGEGQPQKNISFPNLVAEIQGEDSKIATASTMEYVRGLDANGNPIMINKSDLASVVAGQMRFVKFSTSPKSNNANEIYTPLIFLNMNLMSNVPTPYGTLFCFGSETHAVQFYIPAESTNMLYFRQKTSSSWAGWSKIL